ncbi:Proteasome assembly chaperone [Ooceraea biroi]|uniref:Proteasome assembly chaperone 1 n=1 Tax=Ooceraea biroi TaxID=2015173 RepID=A0A026VZT5_OOCBI|nr:Proteasome assembly chaperone [Ooceraea biroi]
MVSHFGEVVFPSSRAFWDDEDEYESAENLEQHTELCVRWLREKPERMQKLIIMEGNPLISFVEQCFCREAEKVCVIKNDNQKEVSAIYHIEKQIYLCVILPLFAMKDAAGFISQISEVLLSTENIMSVVCHHVSQFQGTNIPEVPSFLRVLTTRNANNAECKIQSLDQPNIVFGVGAGVLSYAEFMGISAKLYVLYIDSFVLDSKCAEPMLKILPTEMQRKLQNPKCTNTFFSKGNLYM